MSVPSPFHDALNEFHGSAIVCIASASCLQEAVSCREHLDPAGALALAQAYLSLRESIIVLGTRAGWHLERPLASSVYRMVCDVRDTVAVWDREERLPRYQPKWLAGRLQTYWEEIRRRVLQLPAIDARLISHDLLVEMDQALHEWLLCQAKASLQQPSE